MVRRGALFHPFQAHGSAASWDSSSIRRDGMISRAAVSMAARTIERERIHFSRRVFWHVYRRLDFGANALLPMCLTWAIKRELTVSLFLLLYYLPAVIRCASISEPFFYPITLFVCDDFSGLGLHPTPRDAIWWFMVATIRVSTMICFVDAIVSELVMPPAVRSMIVDHKRLGAFKRFASLDPASDFCGRECFGGAWTQVAGIALAMSFSWLCATTGLLLACHFKRYKDIKLRQEVQSLEREIDDALQMSSDDCRTELERLQHVHATLHIDTLLDTLVPVFQSMGTCLVETLNVATLYEGGFHHEAVLLICFTSAYLLYVARYVPDGGLRGVINDINTCARRGSRTDFVLALRRGNFGVSAIPTMFIVVNVIPFAAKRWYQSLAGVGSLLVNFLNLTQFIYEQFDLGIEREGAGSDFQRRRFQQAASRVEASYSETGIEMTSSKRASSK